MGIHVNIGEAKARLSELVSASLRGEEVVLQRAGVPQARIVPMTDPAQRSDEEIAQRRKAAFGMFREAYAGYDISLEHLKRDRIDYDEKWRLKFAADH
jgi:antitoxin (DNA-binding transcriptional repressor) of toxin-antitoxin stability system